MQIALLHRVRCVVRPAVIGQRQSAVLSTRFGDFVGRGADRRCASSAPLPVSPIRSIQATCRRVQSKKGVTCAALATAASSECRLAAVRLLFSDSSAEIRFFANRQALVNRRARQNQLNHGTVKSLQVCDWRGIHWFIAKKL